MLRSTYSGAASVYALVATSNLMLGAQRATMCGNEFELKISQERLTKGIKLKPSKYFKISGPTQIHSL